MHSGIHHFLLDWIDLPKIGPVGFADHAAYFGVMLALHLMNAALPTARPTLLKLLN